MQDHRVARRYASALFQAARAAGTVTEVESDLAVIVETIKTQQDFKFFLKSPYTSREQKASVLGKIFDGRTTPYTMQLLRIMLEKGREAEITGVYEEFVILRRAFERVGHVGVTTAIPLDDAQRAQVIGRLEQILNKKVEPEFHVDASIIGGIRVKYENFVMDGSVRGTLGRMKEKLRRDVLKQQA